MAGTNWKGVQVSDNGTLLYSAGLPQGEKELYDIIYFSPLNSYFLATRCNLYRKEIDDKPPYVFLEGGCGSRLGASLRSSEINQRLVVIREGRNNHSDQPKNKEN